MLCRTLIFLLRQHERHVSDLLSYFEKLNVADLAVSDIKRFSTHKTSASVLWYRSRAWFSLASSILWFDLSVDEVAYARKGCSVSNTGLFFLRDVQAIMGRLIKSYL